MMNKKIIVIIPIVAIIIIILAGFSSDSPDRERKDTNIVFHATLADPKLYVDGKLTPIRLLQSKVNIILDSFQMEAVQKL